VLIAAALWFRHATRHEATHHSKPWRYLPIPETATQGNSTLHDVAAGHEFAAN
jgi:hypothetical protein